MRCHRCGAQMEKRVCLIPGIPYLQLIHWDCGECGERSATDYERVEEGDCEEGLSRLGEPHGDCAGVDFRPWRNGWCDLGRAVCAVRGASGLAVRGGCEEEVACRSGSSIH